MVLPSFRFTLRAITVLTWFVALAWFIFQPGFEPFLAFLGGLVPLLTSFGVSDAPITLTSPGNSAIEQDKINRSRMLKKVKRIWVEDELKNSLHGAALIALGMEYQPEAVEHPWEMILQQPQRSNKLLPKGTRIAQVFDEMEGELLILGAPGAGKTTMLLELTRTLIRRAERNPDLPIPIIFILSSWAEKRQTLQEWLVDELSTKYQVSRKISKNWIENHQITLLLDGLDEVKIEHRSACIDVINKFRSQHGSINVVVCSRKADYEALTVQLRLVGAIVLQPLTTQQIDEYLTKAGKELAGVHTALQTDMVLRELIETPLMVSIITLAYQGISPESIPTGAITERRAHLFDTYIRRMFERRGVNGRYTPQHTIHWLSWLASQMSRRDQSIFLVEQLQPDWLPTRTKRWLYMTIVGLLTSAIIFASRSLSVISQLSSKQIYIRDYLELLGLLVLVAWPLFSARHIELIERVSWSWHRALKALRNYLLGYLLIGSIMGLLWGWLTGIFVIGIFVCAIPIMLIDSGLAGSEVETKVMPNQGFRLSIRIAFYVSLAGFILGAFYQTLLTWIFLVTQTKGPTNFDTLTQLFITSGLPIGLLTAVMAGLYLGGAACIQHLTLRMLLYFSGCIPWHYVRFLDYAAERIFLRKIGGGYIFVHRLLREHFATKN